MNSSETNPEILEARKKMAEKFGNIKIGGRGNIDLVDITLNRFPKKKGGPQAQVLCRSR